MAEAHRCSYMQGKLLLNSRAFVNQHAALLPMAAQWSSLSLKSLAYTSANTPGHTDFRKLKWVRYNRTWDCPSSTSFFSFFLKRNLNNRKKKLFPLSCWNCTAMPRASWSKRLPRILVATEENEENLGTSWTSYSMDISAVSGISV